MYHTHRYHIFKSFTQLLFIKSILYFKQYKHETHTKYNEKVIYKIVLNSRKFSCYNLVIISHGSYLQIINRKFLIDCLPHMKFINVHMLSGSY